MAQASLAGTILASTIGTYIATSPPNPNNNAQSIPKAGDTIRRLRLAGKHTTKIVLAPAVFLAFHTSSLAYLFPAIPQSVLRHGAENNLNLNLITWSPSTAIPLAAILCVGVPLRLISYSALGRNFTFAISEPDSLTTTGIYRHVQHPGYTGLIALVFANVALFARIDGCLSCWIPPSWYQAVRSVWCVSFPLGLAMAAGMIWKRVTQEEEMLRAKFGAEWEEWHAETPRFIPRLWPGINIKRA